MTQEWIEDWFEANEHFFPLKAEYKNQGGEIRISKRSNRIHLIFHADYSNRSKIDWETWYENQVVGRTVAVVENPKEPNFNDAAEKVEVLRSELDAAEGDAE